MLHQKLWRCKAGPALTCHPPWKNRRQAHDAPVSSLVLLGQAVCSCAAWQTRRHRPPVHVLQCSLQLTPFPVNHHVVLAIEGFSTNKAGKQFDRAGIWQTRTLTTDLRDNPERTGPEPTQPQVSLQSGGSTVRLVTPVTRVPPHTVTDKIVQALGHHVCVFC